MKHHSKTHTDLTAMLLLLGREEVSISGLSQALVLRLGLSLALSWVVVSSR